MRQRWALTSVKVLIAKRAAEMAAVVVAEMEAQKRCNAITGAPQHIMIEEKAEGMHSARRASMMGMYELVEGKVVNDRAVWCMAGDEVLYLYYHAAAPEWWVGEAADMEAGGDEGFMSVESAALTPDQIGPAERWQVFSEYDEWFDAPGIRAYAVKPEQQHGEDQAEEQPAHVRLSSPDAVEASAAGDDGDEQPVHEPEADEQAVQEIQEVEQEIEHSRCLQQTAEITSEIIGFGRVPGCGTSDVPGSVLKAFDGQTVVHITSGTTHSMAVCDDGALYSWGSGKYGCLGHGMDCDMAQDEQGAPHLSTPTLIEALKGKKVVHACCGEAHSMAVLESGEIYSWGSGVYGCLGHGHMPMAGLVKDANGEPYLPTPMQIEALKGKRVVHACCGRWHSMAILENGEIFSWGSAMYGCLGHPSDVAGMLKEMSDGEEVPYLPTPTPIKALEGRDIVSACCGEAHSIVLTRDGEAFSWGSDDGGILGHNGRYELLKDANDESYSPKPLLMQGLLGKKVVQVCCGEGHNLAVIENGEIYSWGSGMYGCLGHSDGEDGMTADLPTPTLIKALKGKKVVHACCGEAHSMAVLESGEIYSWGSGMYGCLGQLQNFQLRKDGIPFVPIPTKAALTPSGAASSCECVVSVEAGANFSIVARGSAAYKASADAKEEERASSNSLNELSVSAISQVDEHAQVAEKQAEEQARIAKFKAQSEKSFDGFDVMKKGVITKEDFVGLWDKYFAKKGGASTAQMQQVASQWEKMDVKGSGRVTREEFVELQAEALLRQRKAAEEKVGQAAAEEEKTAKEKAAKKAAAAGAPGDTKIVDRANEEEPVVGSTATGRRPERDGRPKSLISSLMGVCSASHAAKAVMQSEQAEEAATDDDVGEQGEAAKALQARWRGVSSRKHEEDRLEKLAEEHDAASSVQALYRGRAVRRGSV
jgi:alpha-tubulin suppressor-like RCC1 family protein